MPIDFSGFGSGSGGGGSDGSFIWGLGTGTLADQLDLAAALALKAPLDSPAFTTKTTFSYATATTVPYLNASKELISSAVTPTELGYLSGVSSALQTQINAKGVGTLTRSGNTTDNAQSRWNGTNADSLQNGKWIEDDDGRVLIDIGDTSTGATYGTRWTATLTPANSTIHAIERLDITTSGSASGAFVMGKWTRLLGGYTGGGMTVGEWVINNCAGTGTDLNGGGGNMGFRSVMGASTTGYVAAYYGDCAGSGGRTWGCLMELEGGASSGTQVGYGTSVNPGSGTVKVAAFYGKFTSSPGQAPAVSAVGVLDNGATTLPGLILLDNGTNMFQVADGGIMTAGASGATPTHVFNTATSTAASDLLTFTNGPTGTAGNPDIYWKVNINGTDYAIPGFAV